MIDTDYSLIATKLFTPKPRQGSVRRNHLIERMNKGIRSKLTLVSAPAGFGKTTLLSEWIYWNKIPVAWVSLDKSDNDPVDFLRYLITALQGLQPDTGKTALLMLQSPQQPRENVLANFLEELSNTANECTIVLDDYHVIDTLEIHKMVEFLINHLPRQTHLIIATRADPPFPLSRLRARNQLNEFRTAELAFSQKEISLFFNKTVGLPLSTHDIDILESRTEGWIAGLQLAAISMQGLDNKEEFIKTFTGDNRHIVDYLVEEVLNLQPKQIKDFLLKTSILNCLSGPLCDFVTGQKSGQDMLVNLEKANLFILPLDNKRCWYRYHHLFADLLQQQLQQTNSDIVPELHCRASEWFELNELKKEAIEHALMAEDFKRAARLIEEFSEAIWGLHGEPTRVFRWIEALPDEYVMSNPNLCILYAWVLCDNGQKQAAERNLQIASRVLDSNNSEKIIKLKGEPKQQPSLTNRALRGRIAAVRAYMAAGEGDVQGIVRLSEQALKLLHKEDSPWRAGVAISLGTAHTFEGDNVSAIKALSEAVSASKAAGNIHLYLMANFWLVVCLKHQGQLLRAIDICKHLFRVVTEKELTHTDLEGVLFANWGGLLYELNELDEALHYVNKGLLLVEQGHNVGNRGWAYFCLVKILLAKQDFSGVEESIRKIESLEQSSDLPSWVTHQAEAWKARMWLMKGNVDRVVNWAEGRELRLNENLTPLREPEHIMFARILIAKGRLNDALELLDRLCKEGEKGGRILSIVEVLLVKTLALKKQRNITEALIIFRKALSLTEPGGYIRIFLDAGFPIAELLDRVLDEKADVPRAYVKKLLSAFRLNKLIKTGDGLVEQLSERELEVLRLIEAGLPNKKIMKALFISLSTVKTHTRNIYSKLDVHSRTEAVARAKKLNLL